MKHKVPEAQEAARRTRETGDEGQITLFLMLGERRYDKEELRRSNGMFHNAVIEIGKTTSFGQELMDIGRREGEARGELKGEVKGRARILGALRAYLAIGDPAIERISTLEQASDALERVYRAKSEQEARSILTSA